MSSGEEYYNYGYEAEKIQLNPYLNPYRVSSPRSSRSSWTGEKNKGKKKVSNNEVNKITGKGYKIAINSPENRNIYIDYLLFFSSLPDELIEENIIQKKIGSCFITQCYLENINEEKNVFNWNDEKENEELKFEEEEYKTHIEAESSSSKTKYFLSSSPEPDVNIHNEPEKIQCQATCYIKSDFIISNIYLEIEKITMQEEIFDSFDLSEHFLYEPLKINLGFYFFSLTWIIPSFIIVIYSLFRIGLLILKKEESKS